MHGFKIAHGKLDREVCAARKRLAELLEQHRAIPQRGEVREVTVVKLVTERKHLTNLVKMVAYQAESELLALLRSNYARSDDGGRTLLHEPFRAAVDIDVSSSLLRADRDLVRTAAMQERVLAEARSRAPRRPATLRAAQAAVV